MQWGDMGEGGQRYKPPVLNLKKKNVYFKKDCKLARGVICVFQPEIRGSKSLKRDGKSSAEPDTQ